MSMTAVPISIVFVRAPTAARSGNGEPIWRAKWCTRKYAPSRPSSSAATASSIDCRSAFDAVRTSEYGAGVQCPKERKPIFFTRRTSERRPHQPPIHDSDPTTLLGMRADDQVYLLDAR